MLVFNYYQARAGGRVDGFARSDRVFVWLQGRHSSGVNRLRRSFNSSSPTPSPEPAAGADELTDLSCEKIRFRELKTLLCPCPPEKGRTLLKIQGENYLPGQRWILQTASVCVPQKLWESVGALMTTWVLVLCNRFWRFGSIRIVVAPS